MKQLIKDVELVSFLEGKMTHEEEKSLKYRLEMNGELDLLYHLQLSWEKGMEVYASNLIGEDDFECDINEDISNSGSYATAAKNKFEER